MPGEAREELRSSFVENWRWLGELVGERLQREQSALRTIARPNGWRALLEFTIEELANHKPGSFAGLAGKKRARANGYYLFSAYFASAYFGIRQAAEIDSLRYAIDRAPRKHRDFYLLALSQAVSHCGAAPGHFAQFLIPRDEKTTRYMATAKALKAVIKGPRR